MATPLATAFVRIRPQTDTFAAETTAGLRKAQPGIAKAGARSGKTFSAGFKKAALGGFAAGGGFFAATQIVDFGKSSVRAFTDAQKSQTKLQDAFARFPKLADISIQSLRDYNTQLAQKTRFDDDSIASGQAIIAQFGLTGKQVRDVTPLIADYAAKTGKDFPTAAKLLGKASLGNTRALKDLGINYKVTGDKSKDMANIMKLVRERVGGFAEKEGKTAAGQAEILKNQFGEVQETIGSKLVPVLTTLARILLKGIALFQKYSDILLPLAGAITAIVVAVKLWTIAQKLLNLALATSPIGLITLAIVGIGVALVIAYKKSETFRKIVNAVFKAVKDVIVGVWNWIKHNWPLLLGILTGPIGLATVLIIKNWKKIVDGVRTMLSTIKTFFQELPGKIVRWVGNLANTLYHQGRKLIGGFWQGIKDVWKSTLDWFKGLPSRILGALGIHSPPDWAISAGKHIMGGILKGLIPGGKDLLNFAKNTVGKFTATLFAEPTTGATRTFARGTIALGQQLAAQLHGWTGAQWRALYDLWNNESGWNPLADNPTSTAFGIPQFLSSTAAQYGVLGNTNPAAQIAAGMKYIQDVYGNPVNAWSAWLSRSPHWYDKGGWLMPGATLAVNKTGRPERVLGPRESTGNTYTINIAVPPNANQHDTGRVIVEAIKAYERGSGTRWRK